MKTLLFIITFSLFFSLESYAQAEFTPLTKTQIRKERRKTLSLYNDSIFNHGRHFAQHNIYFATEGIWNFIYYKDYWDKPVYLLKWKPTIGYFPAKRFLIALQPALAYIQARDVTKVTGELGIVFRYYVGKRRVCFLPEAGYYLTNAHDGKVGFSPPDNANEYRTIKHYAYAGAGLNVRLWSYLSLNYTFGAYFLLKKSGDNDPWNLYQNWGISFVFPTRRYQSGENIFAKPTYKKY